VKKSLYQEVIGQLRGIGWIPLSILGVMGFSILFTYEIARPTVEALYQDVYGSENEPWAWMGVAFMVTLVVGAYSREAGRRPLHEMLPRVLGASAIVLALLLLLIDAGVEEAVYLLYLWKDIYIVVLVELFWSISNAVFPAQAAKWMYGLFSCIGGIGAFLGGRCAKWLASIEWGLESSLWVVAGILVAGIVLAPWVPRTEQKRSSKGTSGSFLSGFKVVKKSRYLGYLVVIIALSQLAITAIDYDFKMAIQSAFPDKFARQGALADVYSIINVLALVFGFFGGVVIQLVGLKRTLLGIPLILGSAILGFILFPAYGLMMVTKIASKSMDYSIFRTAKELLYIPMSLEEKTEGKAVVDILTYRVSKGIASGILLGLKSIAAAPKAASIFSFSLVMVWLVLTIPTHRRYQKLSEKTGTESL